VRKCEKRAGKKSRPSGGMQAQANRGANFLTAEAAGVTLEEKARRMAAGPFLTEFSSAG